MDGDGDPFEGWQFDDDFVRSASVAEPSARARELAIRLEAAEADLEEQASRRARRRRRTRLRRGAALLGVVAIITGLVRIAPDPEPLPTFTADAGAIDRTPEVTGPQPTPTGPESSTPLGTPSAPADLTGPHAYIGRQEDAERPIAWDPCRTIHVVVNDADAPPGADDILADGIALISEGSGLQFEIEDDTDLEPGLGFRPYDPDRYGDRWAPVLIAWTTPERWSELEGDVVGATGPLAARDEITDELTYVTGEVGLDGPDFRLMLEEKGGDDLVRAVVAHELGHLVGLEHVDDDGQLMYPEADGSITEPQDGDLTGLRELGTQPCRAKL